MCWRACRAAYLDGSLRSGKVAAAGLDVFPTEPYTEGEVLTLPNVVVDAQKVQESGLLKDTIILDIPDEAGKFDTVIVRRATDKLRASSQAWADYATDCVQRGVLFWDTLRERPSASVGARTDLANSHCARISPSA